MLNITETEEIVSHAMVLVYKASRRVVDNDLSKKIEKIGDELSVILKDIQKNIENNRESFRVYGLYNDHQLDYGVDPKDCQGRPEGDNSWLLQTK